MTRGLRGDPERYLDAYWRRFPGVWTHGDWASVDEDGFWFLHGRSDDTMNVAGKRISPAEINQCCEASAVAECAVVGCRPVKGNRRAWSSCDRVRSRDRARRRAAGDGARASGRAFTPGAVVFADALPKTGARDRSAGRAGGAHG
jgi:acetyl-CoA synthetase